MALILQGIENINISTRQQIQDKNELTINKTGQKMHGSLVGIISVSNSVINSVEKSNAKSVCVVQKF